MKFTYKLSDDKTQLLLSFESDGSSFEITTSPPEFGVEIVYRDMDMGVWSMAEFNDLFLDDQAEILNELKKLRKSYED